MPRFWSVTASGLRTSPISTSTPPAILSSAAPTAIPAVDTYGGYFSHGGGAFSGKDPTKVDRSAAYMARYMAKNLVAAGLATKVQVQLAYAIGVAQPVSLRVDSYGTGKISDEKMTELLRQTCDMTPAGIIRKLDLRRPIYADTAANGHFGIESRPWEQTDLADKLRQLSGI